MGRKVTYDRVQALADGNPDSTIGLLLRPGSGARSRARRTVVYSPEYDRRPDGVSSGGLIGFRNATLSGAFPPECYSGCSVLSREELAKVNRRFAYRIRKEREEEERKAGDNPLKTVEIPTQAETTGE